jgi:hypothetical protein
MAPTRLPPLGAWTTRRPPVIDQKSSAPAHPSTEDHDDTVEAHYACLERPHACLEGFVYIGCLVVGDDGEEVEVVEAVPCRRCSGDEFR